MAYDLAHDLAIVQKMAGELDRYLREPELWWPLGGQMPRLTIGGLLLRRHRLLCLAAHTLALHDALAVFETARAAWPIHYRDKVTREWKTRSNLLGTLLRDCEAVRAEKAHGAPIDHWLPAVEQRTILHELGGDPYAAEALTSSHRAALARLEGRL
ncbi:MAG: hypothetical protein JW910_05745, partial [Anaerolineae bacterium]|nr:hypothetical protein [Anaerolineae bacterium]